MDDLSERDLSGKSDEDLTSEERQELQRRMYEFVDRMELRRPGKDAEREKPKRITAWNPATIARRH